jgi:hypothetical protein
MRITTLMAAVAVAALLFAGLGPLHGLGAALVLGLWAVAVRAVPSGQRLAAAAWLVVFHPVLLFAGLGLTWLVWLLAHGHAPDLAKDQARLTHPAVDVAWGAALFLMIAWPFALPALAGLPILDDFLRTRRGRPPWRVPVAWLLAITVLVWCGAAWLLLNDPVGLLGWFFRGMAYDA